MLNFCVALLEWAEKKEYLIKDEIKRGNTELQERGNAAVLMTSYRSLISDV